MENPPHAFSRRKAILLLVPWLAWACLVLMVYYQPAWRLLIGENPHALLARLQNSALLLSVLGLLGTCLLLWYLLAFAQLAARWRKPVPGLAQHWRLVFVGTALLAALIFAWRWVAVHEQFPAAAEARARLAWAGMGAGLLLLAALVLGQTILRWLNWSFETWQEQCLFYISTGLGTLSYIALGMAMMGIYSPMGVWVLLSGVLLWGGFRVVYRWRGRQFVQDRSTPSVKTSTGRRGDRLWQVIALLGMLIAFVGALAPEVEYDALWYHLWLPKLWLAQGRPVDVVQEYISLYPLGAELLYGNALAIGGAVAAKLVSYAWFLLTALLTFQFTRRFVRGVSPWLALAIFVTIPTVLWEATTTYIDLALAFHIGLTLYALFAYLEKPARSWLGLAIINLGLAMGIKHIGLLAWVLVVPGFALALWWKGRSLKQILLPVLSLAGLSLLFPLPWYLRSYLASGNPFFPEFYRLFGAFPSERWSLTTQQGLDRFLAKFGQTRTLFHQLSLPWDMTMQGWRYGGSLGPIFLLLLPVMLGLVGRRRPAVWLLAFTLGFIALWALPISSFQMRFLVGITPFIAIVAAEALQSLDDLARLALPHWSRRIPQLLLAFVLVLNLPYFTSLQMADWNDGPGWLTHVLRKLPLGVVAGKQSQNEYLAQAIPSYSAWQFINQNLPATARVLTFSGGDHFYSERQRVWSDSAMAWEAVWGAQAGQEQRALAALRRLGITEILFDKIQLDALPPAALAISQPAALKNWYAKEYEDQRFVLYRIRWEALQ